MTMQAMFGSVRDAALRVLATLCSLFLLARFLFYLWVADRAHSTDAAFTTRAITAGGQLGTQDFTLVSTRFSPATARALRVSR
jgi:hypothetical protein